MSTLGYLLKMNCLSMLNLSTDTQESCEFKDVEYLIERYNAILAFTSSESDQIFDEFVSYHLLTNEDIPISIWDSKAT